MNAPGDSAKKRRKQFSLQEKVDLLRELDSGKKQIDLCRERGIAPSTVATIWKDREKILKLHRESQLAPTRKRLRLGNFQDVDQAVLTWLKMPGCKTSQCLAQCFKKKPASSPTHLK
ncbi:hypothetical protein MRX96_017517 [Rhipicephalus microplus]